MNDCRITRRVFLGAAAGAGIALTFGRRAFARRPDKLRIAVVGTANQASWNISQLGSEHIAAICDVDARYLGAAAARFPGARRFRDFREMLTADLDLDAVLVAAPDHIHGPASALALRRGLHVYCEKPLTHTVEESRVLARLAAEKNLATQMGTQIHAGSNYRRVVELVRSGAIGAVREAHVWCGKSWSNGRYGEPKDPPAHLDWNLWLGPAAERPYSDGLHPGSWRSFWAYGTGTLGDMACHYLDLAHWALDPGAVTAVEAEGPEVHDVGTPAWMIVRWEHAGSGGVPTRINWYDGGRRPEILKSLTNADGSALSWGDGQLFVGEDGMVISDYGNHKLLREGRVVDFEAPERSIPESIGHHAEWFAACRAGSPTTCNFAYSGALTEAVLLGNVAYRVGKRLEWDAANLRATNAPEAAGLVRHEYRDGWTL